MLYDITFGDSAVIACHDFLGERLPYILKLCLILMFPKDLRILNRTYLRSHIGIPKNKFDKFLQNSLVLFKELSVSEGFYTKKKYLFVNDIAN